jgi:hypothetical protein
MKTKPSAPSAIEKAILKVTEIAPQLIDGSVYEFYSDGTFNINTKMLSELPAIAPIEELKIILGFIAPLFNPLALKTSKSFLPDVLVLLKRESENETQAFVFASLSVIIAAAIKKAFTSANYKMAMDLLTSNYYGFAETIKALNSTTQKDAISSIYEVALPSIVASKKDMAADKHNNAKAFIYSSVEGNELSYAVYHILNQVGKIDTSAVNVLSESSLTCFVTTAKSRHERIEAMQEIVKDKYLHSSIGTEIMSIMFADVYYPVLFENIDTFMSDEIAQCKKTIEQARAFMDGKSDSK